MKSNILRDVIIYFLLVVGWDGMHLVCRPLVGLLYHFRKMVSMEQMIEWELAGETEVLGEDLPPV